MPDAIPFAPSGLPTVDRMIPNHEGISHRYEIEPMGYDDSFNLGLEIADLIGGPVGEALRAMLMGADLDLDLANPQAEDLGRAAAELFTIPRRVLAAGGAQLAARLLGGVTRIARDTHGNPVKQNLSDPAARTAAYAAGNQAESFLAMKAVIEVNYGPFLAQISGLASPYLSGFGDLLGSMRALGTQTPSGEPGSEPPTNGEIE